MWGVGEGKEAEEEVPVFSLSGELYVGVCNRRPTPHARPPFPRAAGWHRWDRIRPNLCSLLLLHYEGCD